MDNSNAQLKRARRIALVLATSTIITILTIVYAIIQKSVAEKQTTKVEELTQELELCKGE